MNSRVKPFNGDIGDSRYVSFNENPCNMCMPMGGIIPFKGIEQSMVIIHGSQGCCTYMRRHIAEHFNEPIDVASSSLNEKETIYGGENNLKKAIDNVIKVYNPKLLGIITTCLAETIGEDIKRITADHIKERDINDMDIVTVSTPGYGGTHSEGYFTAVRRIVEEMAQPSKKHNKINIIIPHISPEDIREIKRILQLMDVDYILFPDYSDTLDSPFQKPYRKIPQGGTKIQDIREMSGAIATIQIGITVEGNISPGKYLEDKYGVPLYNIPIPMGIENTDLFINTLAEVSGKAINEELIKERGRLLDCMIDSHKYNFEGRSIIFGEPENVYAIVKLCMENGVFPSVIATGSKSDKLTDLLNQIISESPYDACILSETDFWHIRKAYKKYGGNIAIGSSDGKYLTEKEGVPLVRYGFPIHDRVGGQRILSVGYRGTATFLDRITNTLLEQKYSNYRKRMYQEYY